MYCQYISGDRYFVSDDIKNIEIIAVNTFESIWEIVFDAIFFNIINWKKINLFYIKKKIIKVKTNMKKLIIILSAFLFIGIICFFTWKYFIQSKNTTFNPTIISDEIAKLNLNSQNTEEIKIVSKDKDDQIEILRKRFALKWTISRWDNYFQSSQLILALNEYNKALKQSPNDEKIMKKLALTYFELKRYEESIKFFEKIKDFLVQKDKETYIYSLLYNLNYKSWNDVKEISKKIRDLNLTEEETFFYINAINCSIDFHECKKIYDKYFSFKPNLTFENLILIKNAINNYENFKIDDLTYKDALIIWALYKTKLYPITNILWEKLLTQRVDYKPILLIIWKWYYELWDLENAKKYLDTYYKLEPKDVNITYILWNISYKQNDHVTSNLYYNSALKNWFEPKIELQRKLAYNYYLLDDKRSMLNMFWYLLEEKDATIDDFSLWIYHTILEKRTINAINWSEKWLKKFAWENWYEIFYWYLWWIKREELKIEDTTNYLKTWLSINPKNPLLTLNMWYLEQYLGKDNLALMYFKRTVNINWDGEFWELAQNEINKIEEKLKQEEIRQ